MKDIHPHQDWQLPFVLLNIQLGGLLDDQDWNIWAPLPKNVGVNQQDARVWHFYSIDSPQL